MQPPPPPQQQRSRDFDKSKTQLLQVLTGAGGEDRSKKGSLDAPIVDLVGLINAHPDYVTTSSCSGRIALFEDIDGTICGKGKGRWLLSSHAPVSFQAVEESLSSSQALGQEGGAVTLKQEPLVLHIECRDILAAENLLKLGVASGFRESGVSLGKKRVLVAIRTGANSLEAPLLLRGQVLLTETGLASLVELANHKFELNAQRTRRLMETLQTVWAAAESETAATATATDSAMTTTTSTKKRKPKIRKPTKKEKKEAKKVWQWVEPEMAAVAQTQGGGVEMEKNQQLQLLRRWGHSLCQIDEQTYWVFGGWGERPSPGRRNDLVEVKLLSMPASSTLLTQATTTSLLSAQSLPGSQTGLLPEAREKHAAVVLSLSSSSSSSSLPPPLLILFGGRASPQKAFGDLWSFNKAKGWKQITDAVGTPPSPRWSHSMTILPGRTGAGAGEGGGGGEGQEGGEVTTAAGSTTVVIYGGRDAKTVFGGTLHLLSYDNKSETWTWSEVELFPSSSPSQAPLPPLFAHSASVVGGETLFLFGGLQDLSGHSFNQEGVVINMATRRHSRHAFPTAEGGRYGHTATLWGKDNKDKTLLILGGVTTTQETESSSNTNSNDHSSSSCLLLSSSFEVGAEIHTTHLHPLFPSTMATDPPLIHHAAGRIDGQVGGQGLLVVGGGVQTFSFSSVFAPPLLLSLAAAAPSSQGQAQQPQQTKKTKAQKISNKQQQQQKTTTQQITAPGGGDSSSKGRGLLPPPPPCPCLLVLPAYTKLIKTALERVDLFDRHRRIAPSTTVGGCMAIPLVVEPRETMEELKALVMNKTCGGTTTTTHTHTPPPASSELRLFLEALKGKPIKEVIQGWTDEEENIPYSSTALSNQLLRLQAVLEKVLAQSGLTHTHTHTHTHTPSPSSLASALHIERLGSDVLLLEDNHPFRDTTIWGPAYPFLWPALLSVFPGATRIARLAPVADGPKRRSQVKLLYPPPPPPPPSDTYTHTAATDAHTQKEGPGSPGWVTVKENGLSYSFDMTKTMFSSGNVSEKARIGSLCCEGETVVDLYAGIGYFVLPLVVHGKASRLVACEWNSDALVALRHNIKVNGVEKRVEVLAGDNRITTREHLEDMMADRVHLGLLPSSEEGWPIAARLLREEGGWMHVHGNVLESVVDMWVARIEKEIRALGQALGRKWAGEEGSVVCVHLEYVKSFAPSVWHVVADIKCGLGGSDGEKEKEKEGEN